MSASPRVRQRQETESKSLSGTEWASTGPLWGLRQLHWEKPSHPGKSNSGLPAHVGLRRRNSRGAPAGSKPRFFLPRQPLQSSSRGAVDRTSSAAAGWNSRSAPGEADSTGTFLPSQRPDNRRNRCLPWPCWMLTVLCPRSWRVQTAVSSFIQRAAALALLRFHQTGTWGWVSTFLIWKLYVNELCCFISWMLWGSVSLSLTV